MENAISDGQLWNGPMFERFTGQARAVMELAYREAQGFHHDYVGTEHILLGLLRENTGPACRLLQSLRIDPATLRQEIQASIQPGQEFPTCEFLPLSMRAKYALDLAADEARQLFQDRVGVEHLLLGILRDDLNNASTILTLADIDLENLRKNVARLPPPQNRDVMVQTESGTAPDPSVIELEMLYFSQQRNRANQELGSRPSGPSQSPFRRDRPVYGWLLILATILFATFLGLYASPLTIWLSALAVAPIFAWLFIKSIGY